VPGGAQMIQEGRKNSRGSSAPCTSSAYGYSFIRQGPLDQETAKGLFGLRVKPPRASLTTQR